MRKPGILTYLVGNAPVFLAVSFLCLWAGYHALTVSGGWTVAALTLPLGAWVAGKHDTLIRYRAWKREWGELGDEAPRQAAALPKPPMWLRRIVGSILVVLMVAYLVAHRHEPGAAAALGFGVVGSAVFCLVAFLRRLGRGSAKRRVARARMVAICVRRPVMPVPDLATAYRSLPEHCQRLLRAPQAHNR
ncbi:hypothetical protein [Novosphingobium naphthalenivorans]|uniref:hypothetical protein n=1 Tax=Novosphingobium naphthalenivorans TaxID=273168 RepID=UPI00082F5EC9|nr:hypothetical protein [Novosphingobium naphthalenivorans]